MRPTPQRISFQDRALCQRTFGVRAQERQYHRLSLGDRPGMTLPRQHADLLCSYGATASEVEELLAYNDNVFDRSFALAPTLPLPPEPHVAVWERYAREVTEIGAFKALQRRLMQLRFPIREGISNTDAYRAVTLRGTSTQGMTEASGLNLANPDDLRLGVHPSPAGPIPVLTPGGREDFVALVRALSIKSEVRMRAVGQFLTLCCPTTCSAGPARGSCASAMKNVHPGVAYSLPLRGRYEILSRGPTRHNFVG